MTDIVERLRFEEKHYGAISDKSILQEAAAEIERLRRDVQNLNRDCMALAGDRQQKFETTMEHIARDIREGRFPQKSEAK